MYGKTAAEPCGADVGYGCNEVIGAQSESVVVVERRREHEHGSGYTTYAQRGPLVHRGHAERPGNAFKRVRRHKRAVAVAIGLYDGIQRGVSAHAANERGV